MRDLSDNTTHQQGEDALTITNPTIDPAPKKPGIIRKAWPWAAVAVGGLLVGSAIGSAGSATEAAEVKPAPTVTITAEPEVIEASVDGVCRKVAGELFDMLGRSINDIAIPQNEVVLILIENMTGIPRISEIERATGKLEGTVRATESITAELADVSDDYLKCME